MGAIWALLVISDQRASLERPLSLHLTRCCVRPDAGTAANANPGLQAALIASVVHQLPIRLRLAPFDTGSCTGAYRPAAWRACSSSRAQLHIPALRPGAGKPGTGRRRCCRRRRCRRLAPLWRPAEAAAAAAALAAAAAGHVGRAAGAAAHQGHTRWGCWPQPTCCTRCGPCPSPPLAAACCSTCTFP